MNTEYTLTHEHIYARLLWSGVAAVIALSVLYVLYLTQVIEGGVLSTRGESSVEQLMHTIALLEANSAVAQERITLEDAHTLGLIDARQVVYLSLAREHAYAKGLTLGGHGF